MDMLTKRIQRNNNLNSVYVSNDPADMHNGVHHEYEIKMSAVPDPNATIPTLAKISFQKGPRKEPTSKHGVIESDLLEIVRDRLKGHQATEYATRENACALTHIEEALMWMAKRSDDRAEDGKLGTTKV